MANSKKEGKPGVSPVSRSSSALECGLRTADT
jgi:hypothetical protein